MIPFLFPVSKHCAPNPYETFIQEILPGIAKSLYIVDPEPAPELVQHIIQTAPRHISRRILMVFDPTYHSMPAQNPALLNNFFKPLRQCGAGLRTLPGLTARVYIFDDQAFIISGEMNSAHAFGILLPPEDAQPVIEFWEAKWKIARKIQSELLVNMSSEIFSRVVSGHVSPETAVELINRNGAFVNIHVHLFRGYRIRKILRGISGKQGSGIRLPVSRPLIRSRHFQLLNKLSRKFYTLKRKPYLVQTPIGPFLPHRHFQRWESEFSSQRNQWIQEIGDYISGNYQQIRSESLTDLRQALEKYYQTQSTAPQLPEISVSEAVDNMLDRYEKEFPTQKDLLASCDSVYVRFGLHPDSVTDGKLMKILMRVSFQLEL